MGTGSCVIALTLAQKFPEAKTIAIDVSEDALLLARENAARLQIDRVEFRNSDLLENVDGKFDLIVANLPYISRHDRDQLATEVLRDPEVAVFAGERGDEIIRQLIEISPAYSNAGSLLALEIGLGQEPALIELVGRKNYSDIGRKTIIQVNRRVFYLNNRFSPQCRGNFSGATVRSGPVPDPGQFRARADCRHLNTPARFQSIDE